MTLTSITRTFDSTPTDKTFFSLTDMMTSASLGNIQVPDNASKIVAIDFGFGCLETTGYIVVGRLTGSNFSEQVITLTGVTGDGADGPTTTTGRKEVNYSVAGTNNIDLQLAIQYNNAAVATSGAVTLHFE